MSDMEYTVIQLVPTTIIKYCSVTTQKIWKDTKNQLNGELPILQAPKSPNESFSSKPGTAHTEYKT